MFRIIDRFALGVLVLTMIGFVVVLLPATRPISQHGAALFTFEPDSATFMVPTLMDLYDGKIPPDFQYYGHFPAYCTGLLFSPLLLSMKLLYGSIDYHYFVMTMRWTQLLMAVIALVYVFRIAATSMPRIIALGAVAMILTMPEFMNWTLHLHPDIYQVAMLAIAMFCLIRHQQTQAWRDLCLSALFAGFAAASKYYGVFIVPAVVFSAISTSAAKRLPLKRAMIEVFGQVACYGLIMAVTFVAVNFRILLSFEQFQGQAAVYNSLAVDRSELGDLLRAKIANLGSQHLLGMCFLALYAASLIQAVVAGWRRWRRERVLADPYLLIHVVILSFLVFYLGAYSDSSNIYHGERYALPFVCLAAIPVMGLLNAMLRRRAWCVPGIALLAGLMVTQGLRAWGKPLPLDVYFPTPLIVDCGVFEAVLHTAAENDLAVLKAAYAKSPLSNTVRLRRDLAPEQQRELGDYWCQRGWLLNHPCPVWAHYAQRMDFEQYAIFKTRQWVIDRVPRDAKIYTEYGMNLLPTSHAHVQNADNEDLPTKQIYIDGRIQIGRIEELHPDYIFTCSKRLVDEIQTRYPEYRLVETITSRDVAYIVGRRGDERSPSGKLR